MGVARLRLFRELSYSVLRRHLATSHRLTPDEYRARWNLPHDHAMTAPAYSERRSTMAKQLGLGRGGRSQAGMTGERLNIGPRLSKKMGTAGHLESAQTIAVGAQEAECRRVRCACFLAQDAQGLIVDDWFPPTV